MRALTPWLGALLGAALSTSLAGAQHYIGDYGPYYPPIRGPYYPQGPQPPSYYPMPPQGAYGPAPPTAPAPGCQPPYGPPQTYSPQVRYVAPDACGPGFYCWCPDGSYIGPNYCLVPPFPPFNGILPGRAGAAPPPGCPPMAMQPPQGMPRPPMPGQAPAPPAPSQKKPMVVFPTHPYARGPRDYFMWNEAQEDLATRAGRLPLPPSPFGQ